MLAPPLLAIFVGGKSRRMGEPKGLLSIPGSTEPILEALPLSDAVARALEDWDHPQDVPR